VFPQHHRGPHDARQEGTAKQKDDGRQGRPRAGARVAKPAAQIHLDYLPAPRPAIRPRTRPATHNVQTLPAAQLVNPEATPAHCSM